MNINLIALLSIAFLAGFCQICAADGLNLDNLTKIEAEYAKLYWDYEPKKHIIPPGSRAAKTPSPVPGYRFVIPLPERLAGVTYVGHAARLRLFLERALKGEALVVGSLGGSISYGLSVGGPDRTYAAMFVEWLNAALPPAGGLTGSAGAAGAREDDASANPETTVPGGSIAVGRRTLKDQGSRADRLRQSSGAAAAVAVAAAATADPGRRPLEAPHSHHLAGLRHSLFGVPLQDLLLRRQLEEGLEEEEEEEQQPQGQQAVAQRGAERPSSAGDPRAGPGERRAMAEDVSPVPAALPGAGAGALAEGTSAGRPRHVYVNGAVPGTQSSYASSCLNHHLPREVDLIFVEYAVNDPPAPSADFSHPIRRAAERLVRKLLRLPSRPAVVMVNMFAHGAAKGKYLASPERDFNELATYYGLPSVSLRAAVIPQLATAGGASSSSSSSSSSSPEVSLGTIYNAGINHPGRGGHVVVAEVLITMMLELLRSNGEATQEMAGEGAATNAERRTALMDPGLGALLKRVAARPLPEPLAEGNYESSVATCYLEEGLQALAVTPVEGWEWTDEGRGKWGWVALEKGQQLRIKVNTQLGVNPAAGPAAASAPIVLQVAYLQSYSGAGTAEVRCESGCSCRKVLVDSFNPRPVSLTNMADVQVTQHPECVLSLTTRGPSRVARHAAQARQGERGQRGPDAGDGEAAKFKLMAVVLGEEPGATKGAVTSVRGTTFEASKALHRMHG